MNLDLLLIILLIVWIIGIVVWLICWSDLEVSCLGGDWVPERWYKIFMLSAC